MVFASLDPKTIEKTTVFASLDPKTIEKHCVFKHWSAAMTSYTRAPPKIDGESVSERVFMVVSDGSQNVEL